jgi:chromosome segregation ATPase
VKRVTISELQTEIKKVTSQADESSADARRWRAAVNEREKEIAAVREQFADLKKRLHDAEVENARLNGYLARVREDDAVREELVTVGEPGGEQRLVPKRRYEPLASPPEPIEFLRDQYGRSREKPKHWIEY